MCEFLAHFLIAKSYEHDNYHCILIPKVWYPNKNFFEERPKSFFKALFIGTALGSIPKRMTDRKSIWNGLQNPKVQDRDQQELSTHPVLSSHG